MRVSSVLLSILAVLLFVTAGPVQAAGKGTPQTLCPVTGEKISKDVFTDYEGKRVYFCCQACVEKFKADPAGYIKKLEDQGVTLEKTPHPQTLCPVMGGEIDKGVFVDYKGKRIYFCCAQCVEKFKADPETYLKKMEKEGIDLEKSPVPKR